MSQTISKSDIAAEFSSGAALWSRGATGTDRMRIASDTALLRMKIEIDNLDFYYGRTKALIGVSLCLPEKQVTGLIGPSGCGKSTVLRGQPYAADAPDTVRGLGLQFSPPGGELWRTAMIHLPVFPLKTPEAFYERLLLSKPDPNTGKPDPAKLQAFLDHHPETVRALQVIKSQPVSSGFGNSTFRSLNAFHFTNSAGASVPVRWVLAPEQPFVAATAAPVPPDKNYLFDALIADIRRQPLRWHLIVIVGEPGDPTNDATVVWPAEREQVDVGTLTLDQVEAEETSAATDLNFDPLVLPPGIAPSDDPLLSARSAV